MKLYLLGVVLAIACFSLGVVARAAVVEPKPKKPLCILSWKGISYIASDDLKVCLSLMVYSATVEKDFALLKKTKCTL